MVQANPQQRKIGRDAYAQQLRAQQVAQRDLARVLREASREAEAMAARLLPDPGVGAQVRRAQAQVLAQELRQVQAELWGSVTRTTEQGIRAGAAAAAEGNEILSSYLANSLADPRLADQFMLAARHSVESVRAKYLNNIELSSRVYRNHQLGVQRVNRVVARGLAQNLSARELASQVKRFVNPATPGGESYAAMRLARTEINNAFHGINTEWNNSSPFVNAVEWHLSGSHPRPDDCDDLADMDHDGLGNGVFRPENVPEKPHPQCLCYTTAITVNMKEFEDNLIGGQYDGWLRSQGYDGMAA